MIRLLLAYRAAWERNPTVAFALMLGTLADSIAGVLVTAFWFPRWAPLPAVTLVAAVLLLRFAPDPSEVTP